MILHFKQSVCADIPAAYRVRQAMVGLLLAALMLCCVAAHAAAGGAATLVAGTNGYELGRHLAYLEDPTGRLEFADVMSAAMEPRFVHSDGESINLGFTKSAYWFRLDLQNKNAPAHDWLLENAYPLLDYIDAYLVYPGKPAVVYRSGDRRPFSQRAIKHRNIMFDVSLAQGERVTIFIRVQTESSLPMRLSLWNERGLIERDHEEQYFYGIYYGVFIAMLLFNLMIYLSIRDITYLYYVQYICGWLLFQMSLSGLAFEYLWPDAPDFGNKVHPFLIGFSYFAVLQFSRHFLELKKHLPALDKLFVGLLGVSVLQMAASFTFSYTVAIKFGTVCAMTGTVLVFLTGVVCIQRRILRAKYFMLAWSIFLVSILVYALKTFGMLPSVFVTEYGLQIGSSLEVVLLSFALAHRMRLLKDENARIQKTATETLEQHVRQRTAELDNTLARLAEANEKLTSLSYTDALTGVKNRAYFDQLYEVEWRRAQRLGEPLSLLVLDIDHFKQINDSHGHLAGDACLKQVAACLARAVGRAGDEVFRLGGEEFVVLLPSTSLEGAYRIAEAIRSQVERLAIDAGGRQIRITVSVGVAALLPGARSGKQVLIAQADAAMYDAKKTGRNRVCVHAQSTASIEGAMQPPDGD